MTHALPYGTQGTPRTMTIALCGMYIQIQDDAGHKATCPQCQTQLEYIDSLDPRDKDDAKEMF